MFKLLNLKVWPSFSEHIRQVLLLKSHALSKYRHVGLQSTDKNGYFIRFLRVFYKPETLPPLRRAPFGYHIIKFFYHENEIIVVFSCFKTFQIYKYSFKILNTNFLTETHAF